MANALTTNQRLSWEAALTLTPAQGATKSLIELERSYLGVSLALSAATLAATSIDDLRMARWATVSSVADHDSREKDYYKNKLVLSDQSAVDIDTLRYNWFATLPVAP
jgi:hypothetical protein